MKVLKRAMRSRVLLCLVSFVAHVAMKEAAAVENDSPPFHFEPTLATKYIKVTSLSDSGRGTLRECVLAAGSRVCLFEVAGTIQLKSDIVVRNPNLLIAGQTAPSPGITLTRGGITIQAGNVEIEHLAVRPGDSTSGTPPGERNGVSVGAEAPRSAYNVSLRNLSLTWAIDENFSTWNATTHDVWVQNSLIAEGLNDSIHPKGPHSDGVLLGNNTLRTTMVGNLIAFNFDRNPYVQPGSSAKFMNNMVYGWGERGPWNICNLTNNDASSVWVVGAFIGNLWVPAPFSYSQDGSIYSAYIAPGSTVYLDNNLGPGRSSDLQPQSDIANLADPSVITTTCPFSLGCTAPRNATEVESYVLQNVGSRPRQRSSIDTRIIDDVRYRRGSIKDCVTGCANATGGIPNTRVKRRTLTVPANPTGDSDGDGVSNFDEWLYGYTEQVEFT